MNTMEVGRKLVELCKEGKHRQAIEDLYADTVVVNEAMDPMQMPEEMRPPHARPNGPQSKADLLNGCDAFFSCLEVHGAEMSDPYPLGDEFIVYMSMDCTFSQGPMAGQRMDMKEMAKYKVQDGKIVESNYYYAMPGA
ncbi:MAG: SnoaL-like domain-containing protein [Planctomycetota bacterium]